MTAFRRYHEFRAAQSPAQLASFIETASGPDRMGLVADARGRLASTCSQTPTDTLDRRALEAWVGTWKHAAHDDRCKPLVVSATRRLQRLDFDELTKQQDEGAWRSHLERFSADGDAALIAEAKQRRIALVALRQAEEFKACRDAAACEAFARRFADEDPASLVPEAQRRAGRYGAEVEAARQVKALADATTSSQVEAFLSTHANADPALLAKARQKLTVLQRSEYRSSFDGIADLASARAFIEKYRSADPERLVPKAEARLRDLERAEQRREFEAIATVADAEAHIARYSGKDAANTVSAARSRLVSLKAQEQRQAEERQREARQREGRMRGMVGQFVSWRQPLKMETNDCVGIFMIKKCMSVTYDFAMRGKIEDLDAQRQQYVIRPTEAELVVPGAVSIKYLELRSQAIQQARSRWVGSTLTRPVAEFLR